MIPHMKFPIKESISEFRNKIYFERLPLKCIHRNSTFHFMSQVIYTSMFTSRFTQLFRPCTYYVKMGYHESETILSISYLSPIHHEMLSVTISFNKVHTEKGLICFLKSSERNELHIKEEIRMHSELKFHP